MKCKYCNAEVQPTSKFCPSCGKPLSDENSNIGISDMNISWIEETFRLSGYNVDHERCEGPEFRATKEKRVTVYVALKKDLKIITFISYIPLKKVGRSERNELLEILNMANGKGTYCTFYANLDKDFLMVYSYLPVTEELSQNDVMHIADKFGDEMAMTAASTKLIEYVV
jgi:hypothetical protein